MKSKWAREQEARLRERAKERARESQTQKTTDDAIKQEPVTEAPKTSAVVKRPTPKDYEPKDRPLSKLNARRAFLLKVNELAPEKVKALFDSCFEHFLKLTRYNEGTDSDSAPITHAEIFPPDMLESNEEYLKLVLEWNPGFEGLPELQNCLTDKREFCERLSAWGYDCGLEEKWFLEFGWQALLRYWQETKPKRPPKPMSPPKIELPHRSLLDAPTRALRPLAPIREGAEQQQAAPLTRPSSSPKTLTQTSEIVFKRQRNSWRSALQILEWERDSQMVAPEYKAENRYELAGGFFYSRWIEKPKALRLKPPHPREGLPPIADATLRRVVTRKQYEYSIKMDIRRQFLRGPTSLVPEEVQEKWVKEALSHLKQDIDDFWRKYGEFLKAQGWIEVESKKELERDAELTVRIVICGHFYKDIALEQWRQETGQMTRRPTPTEWREEIKGRIEKAIRMAVKRFVELSGLPPKCAYQSISEEDTDAEPQ